jgi:hypothetical protein
MFRLECLPPNIVLIFVAASAKDFFKSLNNRRASLTIPTDTSVQYMMGYPTS